MNDEIWTQTPQQTVPMQNENLAGRIRSRLLLFWQSLLQRPWILETGASVIVGAVAFGLFSYNANVSLWFDETYSLGLSSLPFSVFLKDQQSNMFLYYIMLDGWLKITGALGIIPSPLVARIPSIVAMALVVVTTLWIGSRFWNLIAGIVASLLLAVNALIMQEAQQTRSYALQLLFVCLAWLMLLQALREPMIKRWWILYTIVTVFAIYSQLISVFIVTAQVITFVLFLFPPIAKRIEDFPAIVEHGWRAIAVPGGVSLGAIVLASVPVTLDAIGHHGDNSWVPIATPASLWDFFQVQVALNSLESLSLLVTIALGILLGFRMKRGLPLALVVWGVFPIMGQYFTTQPFLDLHFFFPRYLISALPALAILAAIGVESLRPYWGAVIVMGAFLLLMAQTVPNFYGYTEVQPFSEVTGWMESHYQTGDGIICRPDSNLCGIPVGYYLEHAYNGTQQMPPTFPGIYDWGTLQATPTDNATLKTYMKQHARIFVFTVGPIGGNPNTIKDNVPQALLSAGYKLVGTYRPARKGDRGDVEVQEYSR